MNKMILKFSQILLKMSIKIYQNLSFFIGINITLMFSLLSQSLKVLFFSPQADIYFDVLNCVCFLFFIVEIEIYINVERTYYKSFYFFIDLVSAFLLLFEIDLLKDLISNQYDLSNSQIIHDMSLIFRMIRVIRIVKLTRNFKI